MLTMLSKPLFALTRGSLPEIVVHGAYGIKIHGRDCYGASGFSFLTRSLLNPWQFLTADASGKEDFWAVGLSLHSGQDIHMQALSKLSEYANAGEEELFCPREYPLDWEYAAKLKSTAQTPLRMHHPNSGKHLMILAACEKFGYSKEGYWQPSHPLQKRLFNFVGREAGEQVTCINDSCGLPSFCMPMRVHLGMWERLALDDSAAGDNLKQLWLNNPRLVGGRGRLDSDLILAGKGLILAKEGADGLLMVQSLGGQGEPVAGCLIKLAAGYHKGHLALALLTTIKQHPELPTVFHELIASYLRSRLDEWLPRGRALWEPPFGY